MGDIADMYRDQHIGQSNFYDEFSDEPENYMGLTDEELRAGTSMARDEKTKSIRKFPRQLSEK